jgi:hypothetical protein
MSRRQRQTSVPEVAMPKSGCYNWCRLAIMTFELSYDDLYTAYGTIALDFYIGGVLQRSVAVPDNGSVESGVFSVPMCISSEAVDLEIQLRVGVVPPASTITIRQTISIQGFTGTIKNNLTSCGVEEVDYFDGVNMIPLSSDSTWYDVLGKVNRDAETPFGEMDDPNLNAKRIWNDMTTDSDFVARIVRILDAAMLETAPADNHHNAWIYDNYNNATLSDFGCPANWIYADSVMGGLSVDQKREAYHYFLNHLQSSIDLLSSHSTLQRRLYEALTDPDA